MTRRLSLARPPDRDIVAERIEHPGKYVLSEQQKDPSEDLAGWLKDVGRRTWRIAQPPEKSANDFATESREELVSYLEELSGRELKTRADIRGYVDGLMAQVREARRIDRRRQTVKDTALLLALLAAFTQYHFLDINLQIARLPSTVVFIPVEAKSATPRSGAHVSWDTADAAGRA